MILNTIYEEEVNGVIVGGYMLVSELRYDGRKQGSTIYAADESEARRAAEDRKETMLRLCGDAWKEIYPLDAWELRIRA